MMPLTPIEIKVQIMQRGDSVAKLARKWGVWPVYVTYVINGTPGRNLPEVRKKLARYLGVPISQIARQSSPGNSKKKAA